MEENEKLNGQEETVGLTEQDFREFLSVTGKEQLRILLAHAEKNKKIIKIRRLKNMCSNNDLSYEEISNRFEEFCHTKGLAAKFRVAFGNMAENTRRQREADKARFEEEKRKSAEANPEFTEFLHTKGFAAKIKLIGANLKKGCKEASRKTAVAVDNVSAQTKANIARAQESGQKSTVGYGAQSNIVNKDMSEYSAEELTKAFNDFLKEKGLDGKYAVEITDETTD